MKRRYKHGSWWGLGLPPFGSGRDWPFHFRFCGPWGGGVRGFGFPRREEYLRILEDYKEGLNEMQREIAEELKEVQREIEELQRS